MIRIPVKKYLASKEARNLVGNFCWLSLLQVVNYALPVLTLPYLARVIGVEGFSKIAFAGAVIVWFQTITDWGFNFTATRDIAKNRDDMQKVSAIFSNVLFARILLMLCSFVVLCVLILTIPVFRENYGILLVSFLLIPGHIMSPDWLFQGLEKMKFITIMNVLSKMLFTALVFIFIRKPSDYIFQPLFTSFGYVCAGIISFYIVIVKFKVTIKRPDFNRMITTIKSSTDVFINNFVPNLYNSFSVVLMGFWGGKLANGLYDAGAKFVNIANQFITVISRTFFPFLSRKLEKHSIYVMLNLSIITLGAVLLFFLSPWLIHVFYDDSFDKGIIVSRILAVSLPFLSLSNIYGTNFLIIKGCERQLRNITIISSLVGFAASIPMVYLYTYIGAAVTVTFTRTLMGSGIYLYSRKIKRSEQQ